MLTVVVGGGDGVEDSVNPLQRLLILDIDPVKDLVIVLMIWSGDQTRPGL